MAELWDVVKQVSEWMKPTDATGATIIPAPHVWWRREQFARSGNYSSAPVWHLAKRLVQGTATDARPDRRFEWTFHASCGYKFTFQGILGKRPLVRTTPLKNKKLMCSHCLKAVS